MDKEIKNKKKRAKRFLFVGILIIAIFAVVGLNWAWDQEQGLNELQAEQLVNFCIDKGYEFGYEIKQYDYNDKEIIVAQCGISGGAALYWVHS